MNRNMIVNLFVISILSFTLSTRVFAQTGATDYGPSFSDWLSSIQANIIKEDITLMDEIQSHIDKFKDYLSSLELDQTHSIDNELMSPSNLHTEPLLPAPLDETMTKQSHHPLFDLISMLDRLKAEQTRLDESPLLINPNAISSFDMLVE